MTLDPGSDDAPLLLGRYRSGHRLGVGSMAIVVSALDVRSGREVALKVFSGDELAKGSWVRELRLAMRLDHENICRCLDLGFDDRLGLHVLVFERARGGSLRRVMVAEGPFAEARVLEVVRDVASALAHAHAAGVVHRDVKPENVLARREGGPWLLTDFGVGRFLERGAHARTLTGSLGYIAPEVLGGEGGPSADQYSLGVLAVELLHGALPTPATLAQLALEHRFRDSTPGIFARMLQIDAASRLPSMSAVARVCRPGRSGPLDVTHDEGQLGYLLDGDELSVFRDGQRTSTRSAAKSARFLNLPGAPEPIVAGARRLGRIRRGEVETMYAAELGFDALGASATEGRALLHREGRVLLVDFSGSEALASAPAPEILASALGSGRRVFAHFTARETGVAVALGTPHLLRFERVDRRLSWSPLDLSAPIAQLARRRGGLFVTTCQGQDETVFELDPVRGVGGALEQRSRQNGVMVPKGTGTGSTRAHTNEGVR